MGKRRAAALCACVMMAIAGCARTERPYSVRSLKDPVATQEPSVVERAKAEQASQCGQRHVDHGKGTLKETTESKHDRDERCAELHRRDYLE